VITDSLFTEFATSVRNPVRETGDRIEFKEKIDSQSGNNAIRRYSRMHAFPIFLKKKLVMIPQFGYH
jgi:hypothetical protein